jgi:hypothetical protein
MGIFKLVMGPPPLAGHGQRSTGWPRRSRAGPRRRSPGLDGGHDRDSHSRDIGINSLHRRTHDRGCGDTVDK